MAKVALLLVSVPDDAENPRRMVLDALKRYAGQTYPVADATDGVDDDYYPIGTYIAVSEQEVS